MCDVLKHFLCYLCAAGIIKINGLRSQSGKMCTYHIQVEHCLSCPPGEVMKVSLVVAVGQLPTVFCYYSGSLPGRPQGIAPTILRKDRFSDADCIVHSHH